MTVVLPISLSPMSRFSFPSSAVSSYFTKEFIYRLLFILVVLPLSIFLLAFFVQWRSSGAIYLASWQSVNEPLVPEAGVLVPMQPPTQVNSSFSHVGGKNVSNQTPSPALHNLKSWSFKDNNTNIGPKICITSTTSAGLERLLPWIFYHKVVGVTNFFLFVEGKAASSNSSTILKSIQGVQVIPRTRELEEQQSKSQIWNDTRLSIFIDKPCNNQLFLKQTLNMETAIVMARDAGMEWIFHIDTDELLHPAGTREYTIRELIAKVPIDVDTVVFLNYEASVERDDITEPFTEVSMFKKNFGHLPTDSNFELYKEATRSNPYFFLAYGNGKSAARIQDDLHPNGAHRWEFHMKKPKEITMNEAAILHYTYSRFSDLTSRHDRCDCKPTKEDVEKCFFLDFDRSAFIIASNSTQQEMLQWYREHVVWNDEALILRLLKAGILTRIYTPMVIIRKLKESGVFASVMASADASSASTGKLS